MDAEKTQSHHGIREFSPSEGSTTSRNIAFAPPSRYMTKQILDIDDYFSGPRDMQKHSKLPTFMRIHGSVMPKMILPLSFVAAWSTAITCICVFVQTLGQYLSKSSLELAQFRDG